MPQHRNDFDLVIVRNGGDPTKTEDVVEAFVKPLGYPVPPKGEKYVAAPGGVVRHFEVVDVEHFASRHAVIVFVDPLD